HSLPMRRPCAMTPFPALAPPMGDGGLPCHARWQNVLTLPGPPRGRAPWAAPECGASAEPRAGRGPEPRGEWREWLSPRLAGGASLDAAPWCAHVAAAGSSGHELAELRRTRTLGAVTPGAGSPLAGCRRQQCQPPRRRGT